MGRCEIIKGKRRMIPLAVPNLTGREKEYLNNCIDTTYVSSVGEYVTRLEEMTAVAAGTRYAVATSSGTTGLHAMLTAAGVKAGELVVVPTFTFIASANAVAHCGAVPWLMDISATDWCMDADQVRLEMEKNCSVQDGKVIHNETGRRVAAIMPVYTLGNIPNMEAFRSIADQYHLSLVVDAACAVGAEYKKEPIGELADVSVISFNGNKTITCGGGGMVVGNNEELMGRIRHLTTTARVWPDYNFDMIGFNYRMTNIQAAVGCAQMERLEEFLKRKKAVRDFYALAFQNLEDIGISLFPTSVGSSCWFSGIVLPVGKTLEDVRWVSDALKEKEIESRTFWKPVHLQKPYEDAPCASVSVAEGLWDRIVTLPCSTGITDEELEYVVKNVRDILSK